MSDESPSDDKKGAPENRVLPVFYIQGKPIVSKKNVLSSQRATKLAAIVNPIDQNQSKVMYMHLQGITTHRPNQQHDANTANTSNNHVSIQNPPAAQILPLPSAEMSTSNISTTAQSTKQFFNFAGITGTSILKMDKLGGGTQKAPVDSNLHHSGGTVTTVSQKVVLATPVLGPQLELLQTTAGQLNASQNQGKKPDMASLILPAPKVVMQNQSVVPAKAVFMKLGHGLVPTQNNEQQMSGPDPPPLQPLALKNSPLVDTKLQNSSSTSEFPLHITENPDSAVIMPILKKEETVIMPMIQKDEEPMPQLQHPTNLQRKLLNDVIRDNKPKKQSRKSPHQTLLDISDPESDKSPNNEDDEISVVKVTQPSVKKGKRKMDLKKIVKLDMMEALETDAVELIKTEAKNSVKTENAENFRFLGERQEDEEIEAEDNPKMSESFGNSAFRKTILRVKGAEVYENRFGKILLSTNMENECKKENDMDENSCRFGVFSKSSSSTSLSVDRPESPLNLPEHLYHCEVCGCKGLASEFETPQYCSELCAKKWEKARELSWKQKKISREKAQRKKIKYPIMKSQNAQLGKKTFKLRNTFKNKAEILAMLETSDFSDDIESVGENSESKLHSWIQKSGPDYSSKSYMTMLTKTISAPQKYIEDLKEPILSDNDVESADENVGSKLPTVKLKPYSEWKWSSYLVLTKAKAAPAKLFRESLCTGKNPFKYGMKLEAIDPDHPSKFCVTTVAEVIGHRLRLHFDGYPENHDFWVNSDSPDIFPVGSAEKFQRKLEPPKGHNAKSFNWNMYLKTSKSTAAPKNIFQLRSSPTPHPFRVGMKLEAVDCKHSHSICVATVMGVLGTRILIHFDSWNERYDYWAETNSPYLFPVGYCQTNGRQLIKPDDYKDKVFTWEAYLKKENASPVPSRAFKTQAPQRFKKGMKLEAVDKRVPQLIRVASVVTTKEFKVKIHFDGWPKDHAFWVNSDSSDIHPIDWCKKTGHPLEIPLSPDDCHVPDCGTIGCRGIGHVKGPKYQSHNSPSGCPYSRQNFLKEQRAVQDRLKEKYDIKIIPDSGDDSDIDCQMPAEDTTAKVANYLSRSEFVAKPQNDVDQERAKVDLSSRFTKKPASDEEEASKKKRKRVTPKPEEPIMSQGKIFTDNSSVEEIISDEKRLRQAVFRAVYKPGYNPIPADDFRVRHNILIRELATRLKKSPPEWSVEETATFVESLPNGKPLGQPFRDSEIDGEAFLMLTESDLKSIMKFKLGPTLKIYNSILNLRDMLNK